MTTTNRSKKAGNVTVTLILYENAGAAIRVYFDREDIHTVPFMHAGNAEERYDAIKTSRDATDLVAEYYGVGA